MTFEEWCQRPGLLDKIPEELRIEVLSLLCENWATALDEGWHEGRNDSIPTVEALDSAYAKGWQDGKAVGYDDGYQVGQYDTWLNDS